MIAETTIKAVTTEAFGQDSYLRPKYGRGLSERVEALLCNSPCEAVVMLPARTDTKWYRLLRDCPRCFIRGRVRLEGYSEGAPFPSALFYLGSNPGYFADRFSDIGDIWERFKGMVQ